MKQGDLVSVYDSTGNVSVGLGIFLEMTRIDGRPYYKFLWKGRVAEFDYPYWEFKVIN